jgi:uncharacterized membrane protein
MAKQIDQKSTIKSKDGSDTSKLQIILAEYSYQQKRLETSLSVINQTLTVYIAISAFLASATIGVINFQTTDKRVTYIGLGLISLIAAVATFFSFIRNYKARMEQTDAERALCRLRVFFVRHAPDLQDYLSGTFNDAWPTPYTHRWSSASFWGWFALILITGTMSCLSVGAFLAAASPDIVLVARWGIAAGCGMGVVIVCYKWLDRRLKNRRRKDKPRFANAQLKLENRKQ